MAEQPRTEPPAVSDAVSPQDPALQSIGDELFNDEAVLAAAATESSRRPGRVDDDDDDDDALPPMTEQLSQQLGGVRGLIESGIPVGVFVLVNVVFDDALRWAIAAAVAVAVATAIMRALRKQPIRHAVNGLLGIAVGAYMAWNSGEEKDFYVFGIIQGGLYGLALMGSVALRHPLVGWFWSVIAGGGKAEWREDKRLVTVFSWLTMLWGVVFLVKNLFRGWLYFSDFEKLLGVVTLVGGYPVTALLFLISLWTVRRTRPKLAMAVTRSS